jgi:hypothetical protein
MRHYAKKILKKKGKAKQVANGTFAGVDEDSFQFETTFSLIFCLSFNIIYNVGWYVNIGESRHMTYDGILFKKFQEKEGGMNVDLVNDATYPMR